MPIGKHIEVIIAADGGYTVDAVSTAIASTAIHFHRNVCMHMSLVLSCASAPFSETRGSATGVSRPHQVRAIRSRVQPVLA